MKRYMLVYQGGLANVFEVAEFDLVDPKRRVAKRVLQHDFSSCEYFARGLGQAGASVRTAGCNQAGDIIAAQWTDDLGSLPFCKSFRPVTRN